MVRVVVDTNVIISGLVFGGVPELAIKKIILGNYTLVLSPYIIEETERILITKFNIDHHNTHLLQEVLKIADMWYFQPYLDVVEDEPDNRILETAEQGSADFIITGDKLLLDLGEYKKTKIIKSADFMDL